MVRVFGIKSTYQSESGKVKYNSLLNDMYSKKWSYALEEECKVTSSNMSSTNLFKEYVTMIYNHIHEEKDCTNKFGFKTKKFK